MLDIVSAKQWDEAFPDVLRQKSIENLECGQILFFPNLSFTLQPEEKTFLSPDYADPQAKNISYHPEYHKLWGVQRLSDSERIQLQAMLDRYSWQSYQLIKALLPLYTKDIKIGRTSFRPIQISNRKTSYRKDDKRLHVDAFPSAPNQGQRILRVFCNINPAGEDRVWRIGEPFEKVAQRFLPHIKKPLPGILSLLRLLRITKSYRSLYDHYMLHIHDCMKADNHYQREALQQEIRFPPNTTWIVQTDHVSHAAMAGQHVLEQTFYLPVSAMQDEKHAPLRILENMLHEKLA